MKGTPEQLRDMLASAWHMELFDPRRIGITAWLVHQINTWDADLEVSWHYGEMPEPIGDDIVIANAVTKLVVPVSILRAETALWLLRHCALKVTILRKNGYVHDVGKVRQALEKTDIPDWAEILQAVRIHMDTSYLKLKGVTRHAVVEHFMKKKEE
jgi:hypothetical protein